MKECESAGCFALKLEEILLKLTNHGGLQVDKDGSGDVLPAAGLTEESGEGVVVASGGLCGGHVAVRLDVVLQAVQLPAGVAHLDTSLADVDRDTLALWRNKRFNILSFNLSVLDPV